MRVIVNRLATPDRLCRDSPVRNRIKARRSVRAGDLVPHAVNFRLHPYL
jgi:hypothetical protein